MDETRSAAQPFGSAHGIAPSCVIAREIRAERLTRGLKAALVAGAQSERVSCVFRTIVTARFGIVTGDFGIVTGHSGDVTADVLAPA